MKERGDKLVQYNKDVQDGMNGTRNDTARKLDEILKFLARISIFPMEPMIDTNIAAYICTILNNGKHSKKCTVVRQRECTHHCQSKMCTLALSLIIFIPLF